MMEVFHKRCLVFLLCSIASLLTCSEAYAQCVGLPAVSALGSNKVPVGLCSPVNANLIFSVQFASPVPEGTLDLVYDWGDGSPEHVIPLKPGGKVYHEEALHNFPVESGCEYIVTMTIRYNGARCSNTRQIQKIASWRTDEFNGGEIGLKSPVTSTNEHLVCEGSDLSVVFEDLSVFNCNAQFIQSPPDAIESPNLEGRWQQIIYNAPAAGSKIPNVSVDGVPVTAQNGGDIISGYSDPRGVFFISAPVVANDPRRRPSLEITAPGGFGTGYPKAGDVFTIVLRYWNFCNPYDDPNIPGPPSDPVNGDHPPIEKRSTIRIIAPPSAPGSSTETVCNGVTPKAFSVTGVPAANKINWYENVPNPDRPGRLIGTGKTLPVSSHPEWISNKTPGLYKVWASQQPVTGVVTCESRKTLVVRTIREKLEVAQPLQITPEEVCNGTSFTVDMPMAVGTLVGGPTQYTWLGSDGVNVTPRSPSSAAVAIDVTSFNGLSEDRSITVSRSYSNAPSCAVSAQYSFRVHHLPEGGVASPLEDVCGGSAVDTIRLTGYKGTIKRWEVKKDNGVFMLFNGPAAYDYIAPGILPAGVYVFRAVVGNGTCAEVFSTDRRVEVFASPVPAFAGDDQFHCSSLVSAPLGARIPDVGKGRWSFVSSVPGGLPIPQLSSWDNADANVAIEHQNAGTYKLRWTVTNGVCESFDDVVIDFGTTPSDAAAGPDFAVCGNEAILQANVPVKGTGRWTLVGGPSGCQGDACEIFIEDPLSATSRLTLGSLGKYGTYTLRWSVSSGGNSCFLKTDEVSVKFDQALKVTATDTDIVCLDATNLTPIQLSGVVEGNVTGAHWRNVDGYGTVSESLSASGVTTASYVPSPEDYASGKPIKVNLIAYPLSTSLCGTAEATQHIRVDRKPIADAGSDQPYVCAGDVSLDAAAPLYGAVGSWTTNSEGVSFSDSKDPHARISGLPPSPASISVTWTVSSASGTCVSDPATILLSRVVPPAVADVEVMECEVSNGTARIDLSAHEHSVTALPAGQREITWYRNLNEELSPVTMSSQLLVSGVSDGELFFAHVTDTKTGCSDEAQLRVIVPRKPNVMNGLVSLCEETAGTARVSGIDLSDLAFREAITKEPDVVVRWYLSLDNAQADVNRITSTVDVTRGKEVFARVTRNASPFCFAVTKLTIVVNATPAINTIFGRESVCQGDPQALPGHLPVETYQVTPIPGAKYHWEIETGDGFNVFGGGREGDFYLLLQFPNAGRGKVSVRPELNGCSGEVVEKSIDVNAAPVRPNIVGESVVYQNTKAVSFSVTPNNYPSSTYNWEIRRKSDHSFGGAYIIEGQSTGNILVNMLSEDVVLSVRENNQMCASAAANKIISVIEPPREAGLSASFLVTPTASCFPATIEVRNMSAGVDTYTWTLHNEGGVAATSNLMNPQFRISSPGVYQVHLVATRSATGESVEAQVTDIRILDVPYAAFNTSSEVVYAPDTELKLLNFSSRGETYQWLFGDGETSSLFEPVHTYQREGTYEITLLAGIDHGPQDINGDGITDGPLVCYDTATRVVNARDGGYIKIPNAFTPDESGPTGGRAVAGGFNDVFLPITQGVYAYRMQIFDRWGNKVFESTDPDIGWDGYDRSGKLMSAGVYVYKIEVTLSDGMKDTRMGDVGLIR